MQKYTIHLKALRQLCHVLFTECDKAKTRPRSAIELGKTKIIDLETETLSEEQNLQEALRRKRPDYIEKTKTREQNIAKNSVKSARTTPVKSSVAKAQNIYQTKNSKIPTFRPKNNTTTTSTGNNVKKIISNRPLKAVH